MKPFNLEEAKNGAPICTAEGVDVFFVGVRQNSGILVEKYGDLFTRFSSDLFMKPEKKKLWLTFNKDAFGYYKAQVVGTPDVHGKRVYSIEIEE